MIIPVTVKPNQFARRSIPFHKRFPIEFRCIRTEKAPPSNHTQLLGNKRYKTSSNNKTNTHTNNKHSINELDSSQICIICSWVFPKLMTEREKNNHINLCLEGKGEEHKKEYTASLSTAKYLNNDELSRYKVSLCPFCGKEYNKGLNRHKQRCVQTLINNNAK